MPTKKSKKRRPSDCKNSNDGNRCIGKYVIQGDTNPPLFVCNVCGDQNTTWVKFYEDYMDLFRVRENWNLPKHKVSCVFGFFLYKYKEFYGIPYALSPSSPNPFSCKEIKDINKLLATFGGDANKVRKYIYWIFKSAIRQQTSIVSLAYLNAVGLVRKYNLYASKKSKITRYSKIPSKFLDWCSDELPELLNKYELSTMNDLGAILSSVQCYDLKEGSLEFSAILKAKSMGLIKDNKLNIKE